MASRKRGISKDEDMRALFKEWDEVSCSICMEHPHNAVLLLCSSYDKGCRSYICDTSYRHSNCLDRFRKLKSENVESAASPSLASVNQHGASNSSDQNLSESSSTVLIGDHESHNLAVSVVSVNTAQTGGTGDGGHSAGEHLLELGREESNSDNASTTMSNLRCPLCRGIVLGWEVVEEARNYLNLKRRSCSRESCLFAGNYRELRRHARRAHPTARPADIDLSRQRAWRLLEDQREYDDIVRAIRTAMPGAVVLGDYVIENMDRLSGERDRGSGDNGRWWSTFFLFQMMGSMNRGADQRGGRSRALSRQRRSTGAFPRRRFLWGENLLGLQGDDNGDEDDEDDEQDLNILSDNNVPRARDPRRRRRRLTRASSGEGA